MMNRLIAFAIDRTLTTLSLLVVLLFAGFLAYTNIPKEAEPDLQLPIIQVSVRLEGVSPADAERLLARPIEEKIKNLEGLNDIRTTAFENGVQLFLEFAVGTDISNAEQDVRNKVDLARSGMPQDIQEPEIGEIDISWAPVVAIALSGALEERSLLRFAQDLKDRISTLPNVLTVDLTGTREETVEVIIDPIRAQSYKLNNEDMAQLFNRANKLVAAGKLDTGQGSFAISVPGLFENISDILNLPIKVNGNASVLLRDVAEIRRTFKDPSSFVRVNGERAITLDVRKRSGANIIQTSEQVRAIMADMIKNKPQSLNVQVLQDQSSNIKNRLESLQNSVLLAVFLVMAIVIGALGVRSGLLVGVAIPGAFLTGILMLALFGLTINVTVMFGLIIAVGILVDGAIVVTEYADKKLLEGYDRKTAYQLAAQRMALPIITSTATTAAAFTPLLFWPGVTGQLMKFLPITLICVLTGSLIMALLVVPALGARYGGTNSPAKSSQRLQNDSSYSDVTSFYRSLLTRLLDHPGKVVSGTFAILVLVGLTYVFAGNGITFFPREEVNRATVLIHARGNLSIAEKDSFIRDVENRILDMDGIDSFYARTGSANADAASDVIGQITLDFVDWRERRPTSEIIADILALTNDTTGFNVEVQERHTGGNDGKPIEIEISASSFEKMSQSIAHIREGLDDIGGFINIEDSRPLPSIEWRLDVDRVKASRFGIDLQEVGNAVRLITNGVPLGAYRPDDSREEIDILVRYPRNYRSIAQLDELTIQSQNGLVPISNFVTRVPVQEKVEIKRVDGARVMSVSADVPMGTLPSEKIAELKTWLAANPLDQDVRLTFKGEAQDQEENSSFLNTAFLLALGLMGGILLLQFNSLYSVLLILSSVILSTIGVLLGHLITGQPFSIIMSGIGVIALAGIIVNNNIVLIDCYEKIKDVVPDTKDAILETGMQRLRPVLLTTSTTVLGLLPMAFMVSIDFFTRSVSIGAPENVWWGTLAMTIVSGLIFATLLTLIVTPCALMLRANVIAALQHWRDRITSQSSVSDVVPEDAGLDSVRAQLALINTKETASEERERYTA